MASEDKSLYAYNPSEALPAVFAGLIGLSLMLHIWQNFRYKFWRVTFFMFWGGAVFTAGWITRLVSATLPSNLNVYIAQYVLVLMGPPIYAAAEYNILGRLMFYLPMHAVMNPSRVIYFFIYLGAAVEGMTAAGGAQMASAGDDTKLLKNGATLVFIAVILQAVVECLFVGLIAHMHYRCAKSGMLTPNVRTICITLYGTSFLVLLRCVFRAVEKYSYRSVYASGACEGTCDGIIKHEWYLYAFEAAPMVIYTWWLNVMHPGKYLPRQKTRFLDFNGEERQGPGWTDKRTTLMTLLDPLDLISAMRGESSYERFWLQSEKWPLVTDGSFAAGTGSNRVKYQTEEGVARV